jgi:hypothetical protein
VRPYCFVNQLNSCDFRILLLLLLLLLLLIIIIIIIIIAVLYSFRWGNSTAEFVTLNNTVQISADQMQGIWLDGRQNYRVFFLSYPRARQLYHIEKNQHLSRYPVSFAVLSTAQKETHCVRRLKNSVNRKVTELENVFSRKHLACVVAVHKTGDTCWRNAINEWAGVDVVVALAALRAVSGASNRDAYCWRTPKIFLDRAAPFLVECSVWRCKVLLQPARQNHDRTRCYMSVVFNLFCLRTPRYNFSSTLYPPELLVHNSSYTQSIIYI